MARTCWAPGILWACRIKLEREGVANIDTSKPFVFISNHQSFLDIPVLFRSIPQNLYFVAKKELKKIPFLGWYMMVTGMIFIDRSNRQKSIQSLNKAATLIVKGKSVLMFPEGTRSSATHIATFKKGPFMLAKQAEVEVVPVGIRAVGEPFSINKFSKTTLHIGAAEPVSCADPVNELIEKVRQQVSQLAGKPIKAFA